MAAISEDKWTTKHVSDRSNVSQGKVMKKEAEVQRGQTEIILFNLQPSQDFFFLLPEQCWSSTPSNMPFWASVRVFSVFNEFEWIESVPANSLRPVFYNARASMPANGRVTITAMQCDEQT